MPFLPPEREMEMIVHGDDFIPEGVEEDLDCIIAEHSKKIKMKNRGTLGPDASAVREIMCLNRLIWWTTLSGNFSIEYEADPRHAEIAIKQLELDNSRTKPFEHTRNERDAYRGEAGNVFSTFAES